MVFTDKPDQLIKSLPSLEVLVVLDMDASMYWFWTCIHGLAPNHNLKKKYVTSV